MRRADRRDQLVELAAALAVERGIDAVTMENLAAAAEVNKAIVYRSFPNRSAVLAALFEREMGDLAERIVEAGNRSPSVEGWLRASIALWFDAVAASDGLIAALLDGGHGDPELRDRRTDWERESTLSWGRGVAAVTGADLEDAIDTVAIVLAGMRGAQQRWLVDGRPREVVEDRFVAVALGALDALR